MGNAVGRLRGTGGDFQLIDGGENGENENEGRSSSFPSENDAENIEIINDNVYRNENDDDDDDTSSSDESSIDEEDERLLLRRNPDENNNQFNQPQNSLYLSNQILIHNTPTVKSLISFNRDSLKVKSANNQENTRKNAIYFTNKLDSKSISPPETSDDEKQQDEANTNHENEETKLEKSKIKLDDENIKFDVEFSFDSLVDCEARVLWCCTEMSHSTIEYQTIFPNNESVFAFERSEKQSSTHTVCISSELMPGFNIGSMEEQLVSKDATYHPLVLVLTGYSPPSSSSPSLSSSGGETSEPERHIDIQIVHVSFVANADDTFSLVVQTIYAIYNEHLYTVYDIFGVSQIDEESDECVICMTEDRNVTLLPCRHMCLCLECAEMFRSRTDKCPICRSYVKTLLVQHSPPKEGMELLVDNPEFAIPLD